MHTLHQKRDHVMNMLQDKVVRMLELFYVVGMNHHHAL